MTTMRARAARAAAFAVAVTMLAGCAKPPEKTDTVRPARVMTVRAATGEDMMIFAGDVRPRYEIDLSFRIGGKLLERKVDTGTLVRKGQPLARLDPRDAALAAQAAQAQLASAEADYALARAEFDRAGDLLAKKFISRSAYDARQAAHAAAGARVEQARSQAALSENQEAYTTLVADADGVVVSVTAEPGQVVAAGQPILRLARDGEMEVVIHAPESEVGRIRRGQDVAIFLWADPANRFPGRIREIAGGADATTRTFAVRVAAARVPPGARPGMSATVVLQQPQDGSLVVLPISALVRDGEAAAVWIVDPGSSRVARRKVEVGRYREDGATILSGLSGGEVVVSAGVHKLREGQQVRLAGVPAAR